MFSSVKRSSATQTVLKDYRLTQFIVQKCGIKHLYPPKDYSHVMTPEHPKLPIVPNAPTYPPGIPAPKMRKMIFLMRGPELIHNKLIHKQYGIMATRGGRMKISHFDVIRNDFLKKLDYKRFFAVWRVDAPWQACTKRPIGITLGGGKPSIHHYVTPIKANRIIVEVAGNGDYDEVEGVLTAVAEKMPFPAIPVSQEILDRMEQGEIENNKKNTNPFTFEYMVKNNMTGCRRWNTKMHLKYFGKYP